MVRWLVIVLMLALPLRSGMAAMQFCPWMALQSVEWVASSDNTAGLDSNASPASEAMDDCANLPHTGGACQLQKACSSTPILGDAPVHIPRHAQPASTPWHSEFAISADTAVPQPVPILRS